MIGGRGQALKDELRGVLGELEALLARAAPDALEVQGAAGEEGGLLGDALRALDELLEMVAEGRIAPPVGRVFPFEQATQALEFALTGAGSAKTLLAVDPSLD